MPSIFLYKGEANPADIRLADPTVVKTLVAGTEPQFFDLVQETSVTTGTSPFTLGGAVTGFRTFASVFSTGGPVFYQAVDVDGSGNPLGDWEVGIATYLANGTLYRETVLGSSNANALVNFGAGTRYVSATQPAELMGCEVQVKYNYSQTQVLAASASQTIPMDDTIPQINEGQEFLALLFTPKLATNWLMVEIEMFLAGTATGVWYLMALFRDQVVDALAGCPQYEATATAGVSMKLTYFMQAGQTTAIRFSVRAGNHVSSTINMNTQNGSNWLGGVTSSHITITEFIPTD